MREVTNNATNNANHPTPNWKTKLTRRLLVAVVAAVSVVSLASY